MTTIDCEPPEIDNASKYGRKERQAFFAYFIKGNQLRALLPGPSLLTRSHDQCRQSIQKEAWHCFFIWILCKKQMDCEVPISGLPHLRHVSMLQIQNIQTLWEIDIYHKFLCQFFAQRGTSCVIANMKETAVFASSPYRIYSQISIGHFWDRLRKNKHIRISTPCHDMLI